MLTLERMLQAESDLSMDTSLSYLGSNSGVRLDRFNSSSARICSHSSMRAASNVRRFGLYVSLPRSR